MLQPKAKSSLMADFHNHLCQVKLTFCSLSAHFSLSCPCGVSVSGDTLSLSVRDVA